MKPLLSAIAWAIVALIVDFCAASAQQPVRVYKIGFLTIGTPDFVYPPMEEWEGTGATLREALRDRGYVLGKNLVVVLRHAGGDVARLSTETESLVASNVDVIVTSGTSPTLAAMKVTKHVPIVFNGLGGPVEKGVVASLSHPGGNVTGMAVLTAPPKTWQMLKEIAPTTKRAGSLIYAPNIAASGADYLSKLNAWLRAEAAAVGMEFVDMAVNSRDDLAAKFAELASAGDAGIIINTDNTLYSWRTFIMETALRHRLPTVCGQWVSWGAAGCVATYAEDDHARNRSVAAQIDKVLKGIKPADIPVEQQTHFRLIINAKTAKALDLKLPPSILALADEVIE
jgi:putative ABC transport system substrate-binding protein